MELDISNIIIAIIAFLGTVIGSNMAYNKTVSLLQYRLDQLEKQVNKHNNIIERTYILEDRTNIIEEKIKVANNRIKDLENEK